MYPKTQKKMNGNGRRPTNPPGASRARTGTRLHPGASRSPYPAWKKAADLLKDRQLVIVDSR
jgi:hypothetical protein